MQLEEASTVPAIGATTQNSKFIGFVPAATAPDSPDPGSASRGLWRGSPERGALPSGSAARYTGHSPREARLTSVIDEPSWAGWRCEEGWSESGLAARSLEGPPRG